MKFLSFVIIFSIFGFCLTEENSPQRNYLDFLQNLSKHLRGKNASSSDGFLQEEKLNISPSFQMNKAKKLLEQMEKICTINNHNISISANCCADIKTVLISFIMGKYWALQMIDALAKPPSGILLGNTYFPGDFKECKSVSVDIKHSFSPKYCLAKVPVHFANQEVEYHLGMCVPNTCSASDCENLFHEGLHMLPNHMGDNVNATVHCYKERVLDTKAYLAITVCCVLLFFVILGTLCDIFCSQPTGTQKLTINTTSDELPINEIQDDGDVALLQPETTRFTDFAGCLKKFLLCFSILKNTEKLLNTKLPSQSLPSLHGIRFLSMTWVILGHTYFFGLGTFGNLVSLMDMSTRFSFQTIKMGIYSVDTFFLLSGMLVAYGLLKVLSEKGKMNWIYFYVHRFYRLTPTYMVILMIYVCLMRYLGNGPYWGIESVDLHCTKTWWRNLLYSNNFVNNGGCMGWTWYLANDMQFYILSPLLVVLLYKFPRFGVLMTMLLLVTQMVVSGIIITLSKIKSPSNPKYMNLYMKPYYRIGPYLIGILLGYILHVTKCRKNLNKVFVICMWWISKMIAMVVVYGLYNKDMGESLSMPMAALYWTVSHTVWSVCIAWVIFACCSGYGGIINRFLSWKAFIPLSRLTYCAYLIHPIVMLVYYYNSLYPTIITDAVASYLFIGHLVITYGIAYLSSMIIEAPLLKLEATFIRKND